MNQDDKERDEKQKNEEELYGSPGVRQAIEFLERLDDKEQTELRRDIKGPVQQTLEVAKKHKLTFTHKDLERALYKKWGPPTKREHADQGEYYTTLSECPGF